MQARISKARISTILVVVAMLAGFAVTGVFSPAVASSSTIVSGPTDLGTLGGANSQTLAASGSIVVGQAQISDGSYHAFAYDASAASPHMIDLGTFGGASSVATAVSGSVVVGSADMPVDSNPDDENFGRSVQHAFAYDLDAADPHMIDLDDDDPAYVSSQATGISGRYIVGGRQNDEHGNSGFSYDLDAPSPHMVDLGTLGGTRDLGIVGAEPTAIDGSIVVGLSPAPGTADTLTGDHAFAEDLAAPSPEPIDLGTLGGQLSGAEAISGSVVVGWSELTGNDGTEHAFAYDLSAPSPHLIDLTPSNTGRDSPGTAVSANLVTIGDTSSGAFVYNLSDPGATVSLGANVLPSAIRGNLVVGTGPNGHGFLYDLSAPSPHLIDLGTLGGPTSFADGISSTGLVAGDADTASNAFHAVVWQTSPSSDVTPPTVHLNSPANGAIYASGAVVNADYSCADEAGGSGLASCTGPVASGAAVDTSTSGPQTFSVTGTDAAQNSATAPATYHVVDAIDDTGSVGAAGSFGTGSGVSTDAPLQTNVTSPNAGSWEVFQGGTTESPPAGYTFLGFESDITAPAATAANPLALHFSLDPELLSMAGVTVANLQVFRDGVPIADCTSPNAVVAAPDPCVFKRSTNSDGSAEIDVYSSHASTWDFGKSLAAAPPVVISTASVPSGRVGVAYSKAFAATGGTSPIGWSITSGALPAGLALNAATGVISGTPTAAVTNAHFSVTASDASVPAQTATKAFTITIAATAVPTAGKIGVPYWTAIAPFKGVAPYHWTLVSGTLPPGLALNATTGAISGTPRTEGKFTFTVQVTDSKKKTPAKAATKLTVTIAPVAITLGPTTLPAGSKGVKYTATLKATGGAPSYKFTVSAGKLPAGITLTSAGVLSGKATTKGTAHFTVTATDKYGFTGVRAFTLIVS